MTDHSLPPSNSQLTKEALNKIKVIAKLVFFYLFWAFQIAYNYALRYYRIHTEKTCQLPKGKIRIRSIVFRFKLDMEEISRPVDFLLSNGFVEDATVLKDPHWAPYYIDKNTVHYVLLPQDIKAYSTATTAFIFEPMHEKALAVAEVPIETFIDLFDNIPETPKTVLFTNTARAGSTLLANMLTNSGHSICYAEPHVLCNLAIAHQEKTMTEQEISRVLPAVFNSFRWHVPNDQIVVLKTTSGEARLVPLCTKVDNLKHIFMFRENGLPSVDKIVRREQFCTELTLKMFHALPPFIYPYTLLLQEAEFARKLKPTTLKLWAAIIYASPYSHYLKNKNFYCTDVVWFHNLIKDPEGTLRSLFEKIDIPTACASEAAKCVQKDSQEGTFMSSTNLKHVKWTGLNDEEKRELQRYADVMDISVDIFYKD